MEAVAEIARLGRASARLLRLGWPELLLWACVGWLAGRAGLYGSATLGADQPLLSILVFIAGVVVRVAAIVMMIASLEHLAVPGGVAGTGPRAGRARTTVVAAALGSFLAVFAVWGLVDEQIKELFTANVVRHGLLGVDAWSVDLRRWQTYAWIGLAGWLAKRVLGLVTRRRESQLLTVLTAGADAVFVFGSALALVRVAGTAAAWLGRRAVTVWLADAWRGFVDQLPEIRLPFDLTLPEVVASAASWVVGTLVPGLWLGVVLPLVWLALTAVVFGWGDYDGPGNADQADRLRRVLPRRLGRLPAPVLRAAALAGEDIRLKYEPVVDGLRLVLRAGLPFVGAYLVAAAAVTAVSRALTWAFVTLRGPVSVQSVLLTEPFHDLVVELATLVPSCALYAAAVARCLPARTDPSPGEVDSVAAVREA